jgi:hypothetical protein
VYWRGLDPSGRADAVYSLAAILLFVWALGAIGVYTMGIAAYLMLGTLTALVGVAAFRRRV